MVTLRQLHYLDALADTLHFGQAAEACAVTQPALSMQIKELDGECCRPVVMRIVKILTHWHYFSLGPAVQLGFASHVLSAQLSRIFRRNGKELPFPCPMSVESQRAFRFTRTPFNEQPSEFT
jgi:hypothetical protein